jgi:hypothetical protein
MGIAPDARTKTLGTIYKTNGVGNASVDHLSLLNTSISLAHINKQQSTITNTGKQPFKWKAMFYGSFKRANINGNVVVSKKGTDNQNRMISFVETTVTPGKKVNIKVY